MRMNLDLGMTLFMGNMLGNGIILKMGMGMYNLSLINLKKKIQEGYESFDPPYIYL